jgi:aminoglycoside 3-N-acetyltransferase
VAAATSAFLADQLRMLGLSAGDRVLVHSSLRSVGAIEGGPAALVAAFLDVLEPGGLLVVPTFTYNSNVFDHAQSPSVTGAFTEIVRAWPGAVRSLHPTHSVAAIGERAAAFCAGHERVGAVSTGSPLERLAADGGWILLVGVGHNRNTTIHTAECLAPAFYLDMPQRPDAWETATVRIDGEQREIELLERPGCSVAFGAIEGELRRRGAIRDGHLGQAFTQAMRGADVVTAGVDLLRADPTALLCSDPACYRCSSARALFEVTSR